MKFEIVKTQSGTHSRIVAANGEILMSSEVYEGDHAERNAQHTVETIKQGAAHAPIVSINE